MALELMGKLCFYMWAFISAMNMFHKLNILYQNINETQNILLRLKVSGLRWGKSKVFSWKTIKKLSPIRISWFAYFPYMFYYK